MLLATQSSASLCDTGDVSLHTLLQSCDMLSRKTHRAIALCAELQKVVPEPKLRSKTWLSTSFLAASKDEGAKLCGADYHVSFQLLVFFLPQACPTRYPRVTSPCLLSVLRPRCYPCTHHEITSTGKALSTASGTLLTPLAPLQVHSYLNRVRFTETAMAVPDNAVLLEVGPHALLRSALRQNRATLP